MTNVSTGHDIVIVANNRCIARLERTVNRDMFAKNIVIANHNPPDLLWSSHMLWSPADNGMFPNLIVTARCHARLYDSTTGDRAKIPKFDIGFHGGKGSDFYADT